MNAHKLILIFVFGFLIVCRCYVENISNSLVFVAMINVIALLVVFFQIADGLKKKTEKRIDTVCLSKGIAAREKKTFHKRFYVGLIIVNLALILFYFFVIGCSNVGNDILSILALALSLLDDEIVDTIEIYKV